MERRFQVNNYMCENKDCRASTVTLNLANGVTPFMIQCKKICGSLAQSSFYRLNVVHSPIRLRIEHFFIRPSPEHIRKYNLHKEPDWQQIRQHLLSGGMLCVPFENAEINLSDPITDLVVSDSSDVIKLLGNYYADFD